jgi:glycosyltransferase involved in cell wall biosynthesis
VRLLTVGSLPPEWGGPARGGAATFHAALLTALLERAADVEVVGTLPPAPLDRPIPVPAWVRPEGVGRAQFYEELLERLRPDAVLMNHIAHTFGVTHARLGSPAPVLGVIQSWHNVTFATGEERRRALAVTQEALSGLGAMAAVSRHTMDEGRRLGFEYPALAETIHNPVPPLYMAEDLDVGGAERAGALFLGSLIPRKEPGTLMDAAAMLPELDLLLVGQGELEEELRARIAALGLEDRLRLAEPPQGDSHLPWIRQMLLRSAVMCLPSRSEGLPLAFLEALACGTPIVGFGPAVREIRDELGIEVGEPLDGDTPEEIAAALERVLAARWDRDELRRATLQRFGLDRIADRYLEMLARAVERPQGDAGGSAAVPSRATRPSATDREPTVVCVLGTSRSGTSLTARLLDLAGVYLGPEEELLGEDRHQLTGEGEQVLTKAKQSNPVGHWEHYRLMRLNERILRSLGGNWRETPPMPPGWESSEELAELRDEARAMLAESFGGQELWGWKDPRNSLTLPFWQALVPQMRYVICLRNPAEVAASLLRRDGIALEDGVRQWLRYLAAALVNTVGRPRLLVAYESYFRDPAGAAAGLARFAGREGAFAGPAGEHMLAETIDERLWRSRSSVVDATAVGHVSPEAASLFRVAELLATSGDYEGGHPAELNAAADLYAEGLLGRLAAASPSPVS